MHLLLAERKKESKRDNFQSLKYFEREGTVFVGGRRYARNQLFAHNVGSGRVLFAPGGKELLRVGSFFLRRAFSASSHRRLLGEAVAPRYSAAERFYAEICGFIGNSYEERSARARARKLDELRTIHGIRNPRRAAAVIASMLLITIHRRRE